MSLYGVNGRLYDALVYLFTFGSEEPFMRRAVERLGLVAGDRVLDWGCGTGISLKHIQNSLREGHVYAVDRSAKMAQYAVARAVPNDKLDYQFIIREGVDVTLPEKVDATVAAYSLCVLEPAAFEKAVQSIWAATRAGGRILMIETHMEDSETWAGRLHQRAVRWVLKRMFEDEASNALLPILEKYFAPVSIETDKGLSARAFIGVRRDVVDGQAPDAVLAA